MRGWLHTFHPEVSAEGATSLSFDCFLIQSRVLKVEGPSLGICFDC